MQPLQGQTGDVLGLLQGLPLPPLAGEEKDLLFPGQLCQQLQRQSQPLVVEGGQGVVQEDGGAVGQALPSASLFRAAAAPSSSRFRVTAA